MGVSLRSRILLTFLLVGVAWLLLVPTCSAQDAANVGRRLTLVVGPLFIAQRDEKASPMRYGGATPFVQLAYTTRTPRRVLEVRIGGTGGTLRSALTQHDNYPHQRTGRGWIDLEYARALGDPDAHTRLLIGGRVAAGATVIVHVYSPGEFGDAAYAFFSATVGPTVSVERASGERATLRARLSVPLVALIGRPYSVFHGIYRGPGPGGDGVHLRVATLDAFQAADFSTAYTVGLSRRTDLVLGYHVVAERYGGPQAFRFASQGMSLALALRLGSPQ